MNDEEICQALDRAFQDLNLGLYFQVSQNSPYLYIFINRPLGSLPDYEQITTLVGQTIATLELENLTYLALYSRPLGEADPDWELCAAISDFEQETIVVNLAQRDRENLALEGMSSDEITEFLAHRARKPFTDSEAELAAISLDEQDDESPVQTNLEPDNDLNRADFSQYCFVDDRNALTASEVTLPPKVAKTLAIFHRFPTRGKHRVLPLLGQIFEGDRGIVFIHFPDQVQQWFEYVLTLTETDIQSAQIWFSRYCQDTSTTLREMQTLLKATENQEASSPEQDTLQQEIEAQHQAGRNAPLLSIDARPRGATPHTAPMPPSPAQPLAGQRSPDLRAAAQRSPARLWLWLGLLGLGSLLLGFITTFFYPQGLGLGGWVCLLLSIILQTFGTATANLALQKLQGGLLTAVLILSRILGFGLVGGYGAGFLLGLGVGNILKLQFLNTSKTLPQNLAGVWELISDRTGTIALAIALIGFVVPLILASVSN